MRNNQYSVIIPESDMPKMNTRGGSERQEDGNYKVWFGNGFQESGPLGENPRDLTVEEDKTKITTLLKEREINVLDMIVN